MIFDLISKKLSFFARSFYALGKLGLPAFISLFFLWKSSVRIVFACFASIFIVFCSGVVLAYQPIEHIFETGGQTPLVRLSQDKQIPLYRLLSAEQFISLFVKYYETGILYLTHHDISRDLDAKKAGSANIIELEKYFRACQPGSSVAGVVSSKTHLGLVRAICTHMGIAEIKTPCYFFFYKGKAMLPALYGGMNAEELDAFVSKRLAYCRAYYDEGNISVDRPESGGSTKWLTWLDASVERFFNSLIGLKNYLTGLFSRFLPPLFWMR